MKLNTLRPRRLRLSAPLRVMVRENHVCLNDLIYPIFVVPGTNVKEEIPSMPGCYHLSVDNAVRLAEDIYALGLRAIEVFGLPAYKDEIGSSAWDPQSPVQCAIRAIKKALPDMVIVGDVCLCQYTDHGHCGQVKDHYVDNDATLKLLNKVAVSQAEAGAELLDVNAGLPDIDEPATLEMLVRELQSITDLPLQLDSSNKDALARALRIYNGKPIVNSVNGEPEVLEKVLPLCKKYGAAVVGLAIDERGILPKAEDRVAIARRIRDAALAAGIPQEDIYIDCLTLTASAQQEDVLATVQALHACKEELGVRTILGVSNISFGLPCRPYLNTTFLTMAMYAGLDLAIMNPSSEEMMAAVYAYNVLTNRDKQSMAYIARYADKVPASAALKQARTAQASQTSNTPAEADAAHSGPFAALMQAVEKGLKGEAAARTHTLLGENEPLTLVDEALIPALDVVGEKYEKGKLFLPQLLQAASAAQAAFEEIKTAIAKRGGAGTSKGRVVLATVKGDVHDIGKNIVRVILENYGFEVIDLGRDVPVETVVDTVREKDVHLVGLSALMTTTLKSMEETIAALHAAKLDCRVMVGGAVLTPEYAEKIGADWYAKDAKQSADIAKKFFGES